METPYATVESRGDVALHGIAVTLTLMTAAIHLGMGGVLFTLNAAGYLTLAVAMLVSGPVVRFRWLVRLSLLGFTLATIGGWLVFGARFPLAYVDKSIEVVLALVVVAVIWRRDGGPIAIAQRLLRIPATVVRAVGERN
jgi:hypothetical protein